MPRYPDRLAHAEHALDLGGDIVRQSGDADRHASVAPRLAEDLQNEIGGAVGDLGLAMKRRVGIHIDGKADTLRDPVEVAVERRTEMGDNVEGRKAGGLPPIVQIEGLADLADEAALAVPLGESCPVMKRRLPSRRKGT